MTLENDLIVSLERINNFRMCEHTFVNLEKNGLFINLERPNKRL